MPPPVLMRTASSVVPSTRGVRTRKEPASATRVARVASPKRVAVIWTLPSARWRSGATVSERKTLAYIVPLEGGAVPGLDDLAAFHNDEAVGELTRELKILLDEQDGDVTPLAQVGNGAADVLDN